MSKWIAFEDEEPDRGHLVWLGTHELRSNNPVHYHGPPRSWSHWMAVAPPPDLPPKPLPKLTGNLELRKHAYGGYAIYDRHGSCVAECSECGKLFIVREALWLAFDDIAALREANR